ncbi:MAG: TrkH family potassium uptake protein [Bryobacterales bacterium]|nr:TrkH family potassium uptake protein [Bryobacterales bacterium]
MRFRAVAFIAGLFILLLGSTLLVPLFVALLYGDDLRPCGYTLLIMAAVGFSLRYAGEKPRTELAVREGILLVVVLWVAAAILGGLPFYFTPHYPTFADAVFEAASGFTTTGATVLAKVEVLPPSVQFWRHFAHWIGGMGVVLLGIAILPLLGVGGVHLYRAEFSGAKSEKLKPRIAETAMALWRIYFLMTVVLVFLLKAGGMTWFEALCHTFSTLGTGGFSTRTASIGGFSSAYIEYVIAFFMLLAAMNFTRHYMLLIERRGTRFWRDAEIRGYLFLIAASTLVVWISLLARGHIGYEKAFREALFQVASISTTTGFATHDFEVWPHVAQLVLFALMFVGGCTGSTAGGIKMARLLLLFEVIHREFKKMVERRGVFAIFIGGEAMPEKTVQSFLNLVYLALTFHIGASLLVAATGQDLITSISAVTACMFSIGPGFGAVGPADNYGHMSALAKWILSAAMIAGRLEFYTALAIFIPAFWRK